MNSNIFTTIPIEIYKKILYKLTPEDIIAQCSADISHICDQIIDDIFWGDYVKNRFGQDFYNHFQNEIIDRDSWKNIALLFKYPYRTIELKVNNQQELIEITPMTTFQNIFNYIISNYPNIDEEELIDFYHQVWDAGKYLPGKGIPLKFITLFGIFWVRNKYITSQTIGNTDDLIYDNIYQIAFGDLFEFNNKTPFYLIINSLEIKNNQFTLLNDTEVRRKQKRISLIDYPSKYL